MGAAKQQMIEAADNEANALRIIYGNCERCGSGIDTDEEDLETSFGVSFSDMSEEDVRAFKEKEDVQISIGDSYMCSYCEHMSSKDD